MDLQNLRHIGPLSQINDLELVNLRDLKALVDGLIRHGPIHVEDHNGFFGSAIRERRRDHLGDIDSHLAHDGADSSDDTRPVLVGDVCQLTLGDEL